MNGNRFQNFKKGMGVLFLVMLARFCLSAELTVTREFVYPTGYSDPQIQVASGSGGSSGVAVVGPSPTSFSTREIGSSVHMEVHANVVQAEVPPLIQAVKKGDTRMIDQWIVHPQEVQRGDAGGFTPLHWASERGDSVTVRKLLKVGANGDVKNADGATPLMLASYKGHVEVLKLLLDQTQKLNERDRHDQTALMYAFAGGKVRAAQWLIEHGAERTIHNDRGATLRDLAERRHDAGLLKMLGAQPRDE